MSAPAYVRQEYRPALPAKAYGNDQADVGSGGSAAYQNEQPLNQVKPPYPTSGNSIRGRPPTSQDGRPMLGPPSTTSIPSPLQIGKVRLSIPQTVQTQPRPYPFSPVSARDESSPSRTQMAMPKFGHFLKSNSPLTARHEQRPGPSTTAYPNSRHEVASPRDGYGPPRPHTSQGNPSFFLQPSSVSRPPYDQPLGQSTVGYPDSQNDYSISPIDGRPGQATTAYMNPESRFSGSQDDRFASKPTVYSSDSGYQSGQGNFAPTQFNHRPSPPPLAPPTESRFSHRPPPPPGWMDDQPSQPRPNQRKPRSRYGPQSFMPINSARTDRYGFGVSVADGGNGYGPQRFR